MLRITRWPAAATCARGNRASLVRRPRPDRSPAAAGVEDGAPVGLPCGDAWGHAGSQLGFPPHKVKKVPASPIKMLPLTEIEVRANITAIPLIRTLSDDTVRALPPLDGRTPPFRPICRAPPLRRSFA